MMGAKRRRIAALLILAGMLSQEAYSYGAIAEAAAPPHLMAAYRAAMRQMAPCIALGPNIGPTISALHGKQTPKIVPGRSARPLSTAQRLAALTLAETIEKVCRGVTQTTIHIEVTSGGPTSYSQLAAVLKDYSVHVRILGGDTYSCIFSTIDDFWPISRCLGLLDRDAHSALHSYNLMRRGVRAFRLKWHIDT